MNNNWEKNLIKEYILSGLNEYKKYRMWNIFYKSVFIIWLFLITYLIFFYKNNDIKINNVYKDHIAIIELNGTISENNISSAKNINSLLTKAFENKYAKHIILKINSPGGTPVQSNIIHNHIKRLRGIYPNKNIFSVIEDIGTSGAYLIATSTEKIYCDPSSIVGSIGVILNSFGFVDTIEKLGIERRLYTSGKYKSIMDPFLKRNIEEEKIIQNSLNIIHKQFINIVKNTRQDKIDIKNTEIFSGKFWTGVEAIELGLIDGFFDIETLIYDILNINNTITYTNNNIFESIMKKIIKN